MQSPHPTSPGFYTLSLHDALPIFRFRAEKVAFVARVGLLARGFQKAETFRLPQPSPTSSVEWLDGVAHLQWRRSEEHTSELQSQSNLVCRLLLDTKKESNPSVSPS